MKKEVFKCRWSHCKHGGEVRLDDAVKDGSSYYHKDCYEEKQNIQKIMDLYVERVDPNPIFSLLRKTVNDLVFKDGFGADYTLFALKYCLDNGWKIKHVPGLRYVVRDDKAKAAWERQLMASIKQKVNADRESFLQTDKPEDFDLDNIPVFNQSNSRRRRNEFASVLG